MKVTSNPNIVNLIRYIGKAILKAAPNVQSTIQGVRVNFKIVKE